MWKCVCVPVIMQRGCMCRLNQPEWKALDAADLRAEEGKKKARQGIRQNISTGKEGEGLK